MTSHMMRRAPDIARNFVGIWNDHCQAYDELALPYVDYLIEEIVAAERLKTWQVARKITSMVPTLTPGTASRLMGMKYPRGDGEGFLTPSCH